MKDADAQQPCAGARTPDAAGRGASPWARLAVLILVFWLWPAGGSLADDSVADAGGSVAHADNRAAKPVFVSPPTYDRAGFFGLEWEGAEQVELEQATAPEHQDARILYRGSDTRTTISGLADGEYRFRIREAGAHQWNDEAVVVVEHHGLGRAFGFFALGAGLFLVLILAIANGRKWS